MKIGIIAPFETNNLSDLIGEVASSLPIGYMGAPIIASLVRELLSNGHEVSVYTTDNSIFSHNSEPVVFKKDKLSIYYCPCRPRSLAFQDGYKGRILDFFKYERKHLINCIKLEQPDILHAHWAYEFAWAAMDSGFPFIVTFHDAPNKVLKLMPNLYRFGRYLMSKRIIKNAKNITTVSPYMQQEILKWSGSSVDIIPNGIEPNWFDSAISPIKKNLTRPKFGMISNGWTDLKNAKTALQAFALIKHKIPNAEFHLFGSDFGENEKANKWCDQNNISSGLSFFGKLSYPDLRRKMAELTVLIHPSLEESFGMVVLEAMALGVPVVGGKASGAVPWLLEDGNLGVLVDVKNPVEICDGSLQIVENKEKYSQLSYKIKHATRDRFLISEVAKNYKELYELVVSQ